jgi:hypothetical protein
MIGGGRQPTTNPALYCGVEGLVGAGELVVARGCA